MYAQIIDDKIIAVFNSLQSFPCELIDSEDVRYIHYMNAQVLVSDAKSALDKSDSVYIRAAKDRIEWPEEWKQYVTALRQVVSTGVGPIPEQPSYPQI